MADTLTLPMDKIHAVLEECRAISPLAREGIMTRLKAFDVRPELTSTYVLVSEETSYTMPAPTAHHGFDLLKWYGIASLPYELQEDIAIPHMVVVVSRTIYAMKFFDLLMSRQGLQIGALEFLILANLEEEEGFLEPSMAKKELEKTALMNWAGNSKSIKIISETTTVEKELERHVRFVVKRKSLHSLRSLTDMDRADDDRVMGDSLNPSMDQIQAVLQAYPSISPNVRDGIVARLRSLTLAPAVRPELDITYLVANAKSSFTTSEPITNLGLSLLKWSEGSSLPSELLQKTSIRYMVVLVRNTYHAMHFFDLLKSQKGLEIGALEFLILHRCIEIEGRDAYLTPYEIERSALGKWAGESDSIKFNSEETTVKQELKRHVRFILKHNRLHDLRGLTDADRAELDKKDEYQQQW